MSYPINSAITYTATAVTGVVGGSSDGPYTWAWSFDDGGNGNTASLSHIWTTAGSHKATVTATNTTTQQVVSVFKSVNIIDTSTFAWTATGKTISTGGASFQGVSKQGYDNLFGSRLISFTSYANQTDVNAFDTGTLLVTNYPGVLPAGGFGGAIVIPAGIYAGKVLLYGNNSGEYGYWDLNLNTYTRISASGGPGRVNNIYSNPAVVIGNNILTCWEDVNYSYGACVYNTSTNTFGGHNATEFNVYNEYHLLPSGNVLMLFENNIATRIYRVATNDVIVGPPMPGAVWAQGIPWMGRSLPNGAVFCLSNPSPATQAILFTENTSLVAGGSWATLAAFSATSATYSNYAVTPEGNVLVVGSFSNQATQNAYYNVSTNAFTYFGSLPVFNGNLAAITPYNGKFWAVDNNGFIFYSTAWT